MLKEVAYPPLLGRQVNTLFTVEQRLAVQHDSPLIRRHDAGNTLQRHAFAAAGSPQQRHGALVCFELHAQGKAAQLFFNVHDKTHAVCLLRPVASRFFFSSIFTTNNITAEMPIFTSTHFNASASLLICHSW